LLPRLALTWQIESVTATAKRRIQTERVVQTKQQQQQPTQQQQQQMTSSVVDDDYNDDF